ncbi:MAG: 23S rRNA (cytidine(2498)-2'-O)-methyltransferase RlmM, partial [Sandaracinaceae bacterium]|nr:23S rRNA (cytidine(2498)-2'-O)-methyltransferase RlmM [Sandaracinaceae bacterium]
REEVLRARPALSELVREARELQEPSAPIVQLVLAREDLAIVGAVPRGDVPSLFAGGRARMRVSSAAPSRSAMKLAEAIAVFGVGPERGEVCVDLGAAPGGWSFVALERGARVFAVDRARLDGKLMAHPRLTHVADNAFTWVPPEPVDWLLCDMVHKPLEVARLLASWGARRLTRFVLANVKLPMKTRAEVVRAVQDILRKEGGFRTIRARQLYHDRDEITLVCWR